MTPEQVALRDIKHGTTRGFGFYKCRCEPCKEAKLQYQRDYRERLRPPVEPRQDLEGETWRPIPGCEGYEVSNLGRVYSIRRPGMAKSGRIMASQPRKSGHFSLGILRDGKRWQVDVHRLVMLAFVGPCPAGLEVRHLDGDPTNNRLDNLRYGTRQENVQDAIRHGTHSLPPGRYRRAA